MEWILKLWLISIVWVFPAVFLVSGRFKNDSLELSIIFGPVCLLTVFVILFF